MLKVALLAPIASSLYSRMVAYWISREPGMQLTSVIVRTPWTLDRIRGELRRDGPRLLRKAHRKLVLREQSADRVNPRTLSNVSKAAGLPEGSLVTLGRAAGVAVHTVRDHNDSRALDALRHDAPDVIAFTGGGLIRKPLLDIPRLGVLNCHMGVLPAYRGMDVVEWPLLDSATNSVGQQPSLGLTVHFMDQGVDTGDLLLTERVVPESGDTFASIRDRMQSRMPELMLNAMRGLRDDALTRRPQAKDEGRQFFVMHTRMERYASDRLTTFLRNASSDR